MSKTKKSSEDQSKDNRPVEWPKRSKIKVEANAVERKYAKLDESNLGRFKQSGSGANPLCYQSQHFYVTKLDSRRLQS